MYFNQMVGVSRKSFILGSLAASGGVLNANFRGPRQVPYSLHFSGSFPCGWARRSLAESQTGSAFCDILIDGEDGKTTRQHESIACLGTPNTLTTTLVTGYPTLGSRLSVSSLSDSQLYRVGYSTSQGRLSGSQRTDRRGSGLG